MLFSDRRIRAPSPDARGGSREREASPARADSTAPSGGRGASMAQERLSGRTTLPGAMIRTRSRTDRKSTRLNSSHVSISYAVFCLKKKKKLESISSYWRANQLRGDYAEAQNNLADAHKKQGKYDEALEAWKDAIRLNPNIT